MATLALSNPEVLLPEIAQGLRAGDVVPYLGPGISALTVSPPPVPLTPEDLAAYFATRTTLPRRAVGNAWAAAQYIESHRFRDTLVAWMTDAFAPGIVPSPFHRWLAGLGLPLVVDSWYAGDMRGALAETATDWAEVQAISRALIGEDKWYRWFGPSGDPIPASLSEAARTVLYTPHGSARPLGNFLISDADYVEVLTEIDIQTPIPDEVRRRRTGKAFLFAGCRFHDQMLRSYARQIIKRSSDRHYAIVEVASLTRNEHRFLDEHDFVVIDMPLGEALNRLMS